MHTAYDTHQWTFWPLIELLKYREYSAFFFFSRIFCSINSSNSMSTYWDGIKFRIVYLCAGYRQFVCVFLAYSSLNNKLIPGLENGILWKWKFCCETEMWQKSFHHSSIGMRASDGAWARFLIKRSHLWYITFSFGRNQSDSDYYNIFTYIQFYIVN